MAKFSPSVEAWRSWVLARLAEDGHESWLDIVLAWLTVESGGNVCSTGIPGVEAGLVQTYHPDDDRYGATFAQLRTACSGSKLTRVLTDSEKRLHVTVAVNLITDKAARARTVLATTGTDWTEGSSDFWNLAKLHHALPALYSYLGAYKSANGSPPSDWATWRRWVMGLSEAAFVAINPALNPWRSLDQRQRMFNNAEKVGKYGSLEQVVGSILEAIAFPAAVALIGYVAGKGFGRAGVTSPA